MRNLTVELDGDAYDIVIEGGLLASFGALLKPLAGAGDGLVVVTDENVWRAHGAAFAASLGGAGLDFCLVVLPPGEGNKSPEGLAGLYDIFGGLPLRRGGLAVAFGGGVIGDLCGFAAATWMRGVRYVQAPTTLLAQVDSGVGGKTGINLPFGKNMVGVFYQPRMVLTDPALLETLPERELKSGMAEVIKYGAISSAALFCRLGDSPDTGPMEDIIHECCAIKAGIVARDERDFGERMLLNFGHTLGHAIEKQHNFERFNHGEAVAMGMVLEATAGEVMGLTERGTAEALRAALAAHGIDAAYPGSSAERLMPLINTDKKGGGDGIQMVFLRRIGEAFVRRVTVGEIAEALEGVGGL